MSLWIDVRRERSQFNGRNAYLMQLLHCLGRLVKGSIILLD